MPGLSQLKQFNKDIQTLGDELTLRAARGEKPVLVPIPKGLTVDNDAEDFVLGMPDNPRIVDNSNVDEDLSEITGFSVNTSSAKNEADDKTPSFEAPDLSSLLAPVNVGGDSSDDSFMPDLSQFMDTPEPEPEEEIEEEPEEISVADMGLEALLAGAGFDGTEGTEQEENPQVEEEELYEIPEKEPEPEDPNELKVDFGEDLNKQEEERTRMPGDAMSLEELGFSDTPAPSQNDSILEPVEDLGLEDELEPLEDLDLPDADSFTSNENSDLLEPLSEEPVEQTEDLSSLDDFDFKDTETFETEDNADLNTPDSGAIDLDSPAEQSALSSEENFDLPDADSFGSNDNFDLSGMDDLESLDDSLMEEPSSLDNSLGDSGTDTFETEDFGNEDFGSEDFGTDDTAKEDLGSEDFGNEDFGNEDFGSEDFSSDTADSSNDDSFDAGPSTADLFDAQDTELPDIDTAMEDIPDDESDFGEESDNTFESESSEPLETFDISEMNDVDFGIQDTDAQLSVDTGDGDFELDENNISMEGTDFEIPGFSDVQTAPEPKKAAKKVSNLDEPDFSQAVPGNSLPPNTLSDEQYKKFLKNLSDYPLNVRLAFEDFIVQDEFTDDAEFEIIEKILNKAPARQVASTLEKMLDISIPVPRDFEHRTAEEYEAYKQSLSYQLKNKILPGLLCVILLIFVSWGLFNFGKNCIYIPAKASKLYKQGYALLQADEYAQSQIKFDEAASYKMKKKWFFNFARGYKDHKQYQRSADIYEKILYYFNHDKTAGLEYAGMELNDLSNYERAEEITRREILDYHINDADGILMLGDIFLEWGTEKDSSKLDSAKEEYMKLIQLYKPNDLYNSRMMRYYIRTDNLQQVLFYREMFESNKKTQIEACDWTELGGYLLEKLYGPLAPSEEYLRYNIEGLRKLLQKAVVQDSENPIAMYNLGKYYVQTNDSTYIQPTLKAALEKFNNASQLKKRDIYKYIDTYRLLGENYLLTNDYLQAQEQFTEGITLYTTEKENAGFEGNEQVGLLYSDLGNINYSVAGDYENAAKNYKNAISLGYDNSKLRYRLGYISYMDKNYLEALGSFMKAGEGNVKERNLLLAMANTLSLRNDDYAAEGYYEQLIVDLDNEVVERGGSVFPQADKAGNDLVTTYLYAANNYGVTLYKLAKRTGNSQKNAQAIAQFQQSLRAWDSLTRNQTTLVRLEGSNLAEENIKYLTHPISEFEPAIYLDIPKNLTENEGL